MVAFGSADPLDAVMIDDKICKGVGKILTFDGTNNKVDLSAATEIAIGISAGESERDSSRGMDITAPKVSFFPLGGVLMVQVAAGETLTTGETMYVGANGLATSTAGSNKKLGLYVGKGIDPTPALVDSGAGDKLTNAGVAGNGTTELTEGALIPIMTAGAAIA
tara:strand:- start:195 stop:686 length:492 start_codon:yes stop_codon:yes gene_type:complete